MTFLEEMLVMKMFFNRRKGFSKKHVLMEYINISQPLWQITLQNTVKIIDKYKCDLQPGITAKFKQNQVDDTSVKHSNPTSVNKNAFGIMSENMTPD